MQAHAAIPTRTQAPETNGARGRLQDVAQKPEVQWEGWRALMKQPSTLPRWALFITHGALILTVLTGVVTFGRFSGRTENALAAYRDVPQIQANVASVTTQLTEIKDLIQKQNETTNKTLDAQNRRIDSVQSAQTQAIAALSDKLNTVQSQMGSVWALAQSDSNKVSELKGMVSAMQSQMSQQRKEPNK